MNSQADASFGGSASIKATSTNSDVNSSIAVTSAPSSSTNDSTSISPSSSSALPDVQAVNIPTSTSLAPPIAASVCSNVKSNSGQNTTPSGNDNYNAGDAHPVNKSERTSLNRNTNGSESRTSTEGHRTPNIENLSKTNLYIRGLATNTTDEALYNLCSQFGNITSTKAILDKLTGNCRGYGFVQFNNPRSAEVAVQELNKSGVQAQMARLNNTYSSHNQHHHNQHHGFHHNHFHPNHQNNSNPHHHHPNGGNNHGGGVGTHRNHNSTHSHSQNASNIHHNNNDPDPTNLYIANLPTNMSEQELEMLLSQYGPVVSTRILRDLDNRSKGVGFARMESRDKCQEIIDNLNGKPYKGSSETLLVKFADGGVKKRHQHSNHHHNNHYSHYHPQHHKLHQDENRWRDTGNTSGDSSDVSSFVQQSNIPHGNQMSDLTMMGTMGYHRLHPTFPPAMAPGAAYSTPLGPPTSGPQWIHPGGPGQPWNLVPQHMIPTSGLAPSSQAAAAAAMFHSQLASQMQGLQISHHSGAPMPEGYLPQWPAMWPHPVQPHQAGRPHSMRIAEPIQHLATTQQAPQDQAATATTSTASEVAARSKSTMEIGGGNVINATNKES